jgi:hypothetical protein
LLRVLFSSLFIIQFFFFCRAGVSLSRGYAGLSQGWLWDTACCSFVHLLVCISHAGLEPAFGSTGALLVLSVMWHGETLCGLGLGCWSFASSWWFFSAKCHSSISGRFLIYGDHAVCFLPLVAILDPVHISPLILFMTNSIFYSHINRFIGNFLKFLIGPPHVSHFVISLLSNVHHSQIASPQH